jgi:hypothetical protein
LRIRENILLIRSSRYLSTIEERFKSVEEKLVATEASLARHERLFTGLEKCTRKRGSNKQDEWISELTLPQKDNCPGDTTQGDSLTKIHLHPVELQHTALKETLTDGIGVSFTDVEESGFFGQYPLILKQIHSDIIFRAIFEYGFYETTVQNHDL